MSTAYVLTVFVIAIVLMIVLISRFHVNAAMGILAAALVLAIALHTPWEEIEGTIIPYDPDKTEYHVTAIMG